MSTRRSRGRPPGRISVTPRIRTTVDEPESNNVDSNLNEQIRQLIEQNQELQNQQRVILEEQRILSERNELLTRELRESRELRPPNLNINTPAVNTSTNLVNQTTSTCNITPQPIIHSNSSPVNYGTVNVPTRREKVLEHPKNEPSLDPMDWLEEFEHEATTRLRSEEFIIDSFKILIGKRYQDWVKSIKQQELTERITYTWADWKQKFIERVCDRRYRLSYDQKLNNMKQTRNQRTSDFLQEFKKIHERSTHSDNWIDCAKLHMNILIGSQLQTAVTEAQILDKVKLIEEIWMQESITSLDANKSRGTKRIIDQPENNKRPRIFVAQNESDISTTKVNFKTNNGSSPQNIPSVQTSSPQEVTLINTQPTNYVANPNPQQYWPTQQNYPRYPNPNLYYNTPRFYDPTSYTNTPRNYYPASTNYQNYPPPSFRTPRPPRPRFNNTTDSLKTIPKSIQKINSKTTCRFCHKEGHYIRECPDVTCYFCQNKGHISIYCPNNPNGLTLKPAIQPTREDHSTNIITANPQDLAEQNSSNDVATPSKPVITNVQSRVTTTPNYQLTIIIRNQLFKAKIDTGSDVSLIIKAASDKLKLPIREHTQRLRGIGGSILSNGKIHCLVGIPNQKLRYNSHVALIVCDQLPIQESVLLGRDYLKNIHACLDLQSGQLIFKQPVHNKQQVIIPPLTTQFVHVIHDVKPNETKSLDSQFPDLITTCLITHEITQVPATNNRLIDLLLPAGEIIGHLEDANVEEIQTVCALAVNEEAVNYHTLEEILEEYKDVYTTEKLGRTQVTKFKIQLEDETPIQSAPYRQSKAKRELTQQEVQRLLNLQLIENSRSPWASPIVLVPKPNGEVRFCIDYRQLNKQTKKDRYPLPNINDCLASLEGHTWFSTIDLTAGYHQIELHEDSKEYTAFITPDGLWHWNVMPFGLCNAPAEFQRCMDRVLAGYKFNTCLWYLDDVLISSEEPKKHLNDIAKVLQRFRESGLTINPEKCKLMQREVNYLGHQINQEGIVPLSTRVEAIAKLDPPTNITGLRSFLGMCNFYRKFIENFSIIASPLYQLLHKDVQFEFGERELQAFEQLKESLVNAPVLKHFNSDYETEVRVDASGLGFGAILLQKFNDHFHPVCYASRTLKSAERNYSPTEKEAAAIVWGIETFRVYLEGIHFTIITDHAPLTSFNRVMNTTPRLIRFRTRLAIYDFEIKYKPGKRHYDADHLSRYPLTRYHQNAEENLDNLPTVLINQILNEETTNLTERENNYLPEEMIKTIYEDQTTDAYIITLREKLKNLHQLTIKQRRGLERYIIKKDDLLYRMVYYLSVPIYVPVVSTNYLKPITIRMHNEGHRSAQAIYLRVQRIYYSRNMNNKISKWLRTCEVCNRIKLKLPPQNPLLQQFASRPFERVGIDIMGPFDQSCGKVYIINAFDYYSRWLIASAVASFNAQKTADFLYREIVTKFGPIEILVSDRGANFLSNLVTEFTKLMAIKHVSSSGFAPKTSGGIERINGIEKVILQSLVEQNPKTWSQLLPLAVYFYNTTIQSDTKLSPYEILFCRSPASLHPAVQDYQHVINKVIANNADKVREIVEVAQRQRKDNQAFQFNRDKELRIFNKGDLVKFYSPRVTPRSKLERHYLGPATIVDQINQNAYLIEYNGQQRSINIDKLMPWFSSETEI